MAAKRSGYFDELKFLASRSRYAAECFHQMAERFRPELLEEVRKQITEIVQESEARKRDVFWKLQKEFVPPMEREDIVSAAQGIVGVTQTIQDAAEAIAQYCPTKLRTETMMFTQNILEICGAMERMIGQLENFQKPERVFQKVRQITELREKGQMLYHKTMKRLYKDCSVPIEVVAWSGIFFRLAECGRACRKLENLMEIILLKNT